MPAAPVEAMHVVSVRRRSAAWGVTVALASGRRFRLDPRRLLDLPLSPGVSIDGATVDRLERWQRQDAAERRMLRLLAIRPRSRAELERRLGELGLAEAEVGEVLGRLTAVGLIDDRAMAGAVVAGALRRGAGAMRIAADLERWGIDSETAVEALAGADRDSELTRAGRVARQRFGDPPWTPRERARIARHLAGRGFEPDTVEAVAGDD